MAKLPPFHSRLEASKAPYARLYHCNDLCPLGQAIRPIDRVAGSGGFRLCRECDRLNAREPGKWL